MKRHAWKQFCLNALGRFQLGDHEYIKATFGPWPLRFFITVWEPRYRGSKFRKAFPWRIRCCLATVLSKRLYSTCTLCGSEFSLRELLRRDSKLVHFQSGSICHRNCRYTQASAAAHIPEPEAQRQALRETWDRREK